MNVTILNRFSYDPIALLAHARMFISNGWAVEQPVELKNGKCAGSYQFGVWFLLSEKEATAS